MSKTRQPVENSESPEAVKRLFQELADGKAGSCQGMVIWAILVSNPWFRAEVGRRAKRFVRSHGLRYDLSEDIAQEVLLLLAAKLAADPSMHANAELLPETFAAWIDRILDHACSDAARLLGELRPRHGELDNMEEAADESPVMDRVSDCSAAVAKLEGKQRSVMLLVLAGRKRTEIADILHMS